MTKHHLHVSRDDLAEYLLQRTCVFWERPTVNGYGKDLCATLSQGLQELRVGHAILLHGDAKSLDGTVLVERGDDLYPCVRFGHRQRWLETECLEGCDRLGSSGNESRLLERCHNRGPGIARFEEIEQRGCADTGKKHEKIDSLGCELDPKLQRRGIVIQRNFAKGRSDARVSPVALYEPGDLGLHAAFEGSDGQTIEANGNHYDFEGKSVIGFARIRTPNTVETSNGEADIVADSWFKIGSVKIVPQPGEEAQPPVRSR